MALIFTSLLAIAGYMVQSKNAADADRAQHEIVQEAADREKAEAKAGKQLERVQLQMAEWVRPIIVENQSLGFGWIMMAKVRRPREHAM
jgi:hypothetical protein